eukprot:766099-Hanusia_phi.AAC.7
MMMMMMMIPPLFEISVPMVVPIASMPSTSSPVVVYLLVTVSMCVSAKIEVKTSSRFLDMAAPIACSSPFIAPTSLSFSIIAQILRGGEALEDHLRATSTIARLFVLLTTPLQSSLPQQEQGSDLVGSAPTRLHRVSPEHVLPDHLYSIQIRFRISFIASLCSRYHLERFCPDQSCRPESIIGLIAVTSFACSIDVHLSERRRVCNLGLSFCLAPSSLRWGEPPPCLDRLIGSSLSWLQLDMRNYPASLRALQRYPPPVQLALLVASVFSLNVLIVWTDSMLSPGIHEEKGRSEGRSKGGNPR